MASVRHNELNTVIEDILWQNLSYKITWHEVKRETDRVDSRLAPSQWETSLQSNTVSHWLGANLESAMGRCDGMKSNIHFRIRLRLNTQCQVQIGHKRNHCLLRTMETESCDNFNFVFTFSARDCPYNKLHGNQWRQNLLALWRLLFWCGTRLIKSWPRYSMQWKPR